MAKKDNIILIGFMGAGKTTFARWISQNVDMQYIDTDDYIEESEETTINNIFADKGEEYFRDLETRTLEELCTSADNSVISAGGGMPVREKNRVLMKQLGTVVYLRADEEELAVRLEGDNKRPMLAGADLRSRIHELMLKRETAYLDASDVIVDTKGKTMDMIYNEIEDSILKLNRNEVSMKIIVINGPNINFLGIREKGIYGTQNYESLVEMINNKATELGADVEVYQNNSEGAIIDRIQQAYNENADAIIINPGAYTHYSYAIRDALASVEGIVKIEVHISNVHKREEFRHVSVTAPACTGQIVGLGLTGYLLAMEAAVSGNLS